MLEVTKECTITPELISVDIAYANAPMPDIQESINMKAYHAAQAIEKSLKYILYIKNRRLFNKLPSTHSLFQLLNSVEIAYHGFIASHEEISEKAGDIAAMNTARYNAIQISKDDMLNVISLANSLYNEAIKDKVKEEAYIQNINKNQNVSQYNSEKRTDIAQAHKEHINKYKMAHNIGVAECMRENAYKYNLDPDIMYVVGLLHDIGYLQGREGHEHKGADILRRMGIKEQYIYAIENHGKDLSKLSEMYYNETGKQLIEECPEIIALCEADMSVNSKGYKVGFDKRLNELRYRYQDKEDFDNRAENTVSYLKEQLNDVNKTKNKDDNQWNSINKNTIKQNKYNTRNNQFKRFQKKERE